MEKLSIPAKDFVYKKIREGEGSNQAIVKKLHSDYNVSVSPERISQMRKLSWMQDLTLTTKDVEKKLKKKIKVDTNILEITRLGTDCIKKWIVTNEEKLSKCSVKEISMFSSSLHKFLKTYEDMTGGDTRQTFNKLQVFNDKAGG